MCNKNKLTMPNFDVLRINQTHLARVLAEKRSVKSINESIADDKSITLFKRWQNYIRKELFNSKSQTSIIVEYIAE